MEYLNWPLIVAIVLIVSSIVIWLYWPDCCDEKEKEKEDYVACATCKHLVMRGNACEVKQTIGMASYGSTIVYFCPEHKKKYKEQYIDHIYKVHYYAKVEVLEDGTPIGYQKIEEVKTGSVKMV